MLRGDADAHDLAQEVFVRLWKHRELVRDQEALVAWLYRTCTRLVIDRARQRSLGDDNIAHLRDVLWGDTDHDGEARLMSREQLRSVLARCSKEELEAAILSRIDRMTQPEIAELMGVGERTVRRLLARFDEYESSLKETAS